MMGRNRNLIFDVGLHKGEDTEFYLKKGFKVVAFEADPSSIGFCKEKFSDEISDGKLVIVEGAIVDRSSYVGETVKFFKNEDHSVWGTIDPDWAARNESLGTSSTVIEVQTIELQQCFEEFGVPYYLKIDIEGMDLVCLEALTDLKDKPAYVSIESEKVNFQDLLSEFEIFDRLGYDKFQLINQSEVNGHREPNDSLEGGFQNCDFKPGASGLFGSDLRGAWLEKGDAIKKYKWIFRGYRIWGDSSKYKNWMIMKVLRKLLVSVLGTNIPGWYDTHARHSSVQE